MKVGAPRAPRKGKLLMCAASVDIVTRGSEGSGGSVGSGASVGTGGGSEAGTAGDTTGADGCGNTGEAEGSGRVEADNVDRTGGTELGKMKVPCGTVSRRVGEGYRSGEDDVEGSVVVGRDGVAAKSEEYDECVTDGTMRDS